MQSSRSLKRSKPDYCDDTSAILVPSDHRAARLFKVLVNSRIFRKMFSAFVQPH